MTQAIRLFMFFEGAAFIAAALTHFGVLIRIFTIAIGVSPRTVPDIAYHVIILIALLSGLIVALRAC